MTHAPAGWYPDPTVVPAQAPTLRYWDGTRWTGHVAQVPRATPAPRVSYPAPGPTTPDGQPLAGWWWRVLAHVIDGALIGVVSSIVMLPAQIAFQVRMNELTRELESDTSAGFGDFWAGSLELMQDLMVWQLPVVVLVAAYYAVMLRWKGATVGKLAVGLRVRLRERPGRLPWSAVAVRVLVVNLLAVVPLGLFIGGWWVAALAAWAVVALFGMLDVLWPLWDGKRQAIHDKLARTNVVTLR